MSYVPMPEKHPYADILRKEFESVMGKTKKFYPFKPSNRIIDMLFRKFYVEEQCENWFDEYETYPDWCTWQDPIACGIWHMTQPEVDHQSKYVMKRIKSLPGCKRNRFFYAWDDKNEILHIHWFGRDRGAHCDVWWAMKKRGNTHAEV